MVWEEEKVQETGLDSHFYLLFLIEVDNVVKCHLQANLELHDFSLNGLLGQKIFKLLHNMYDHKSHIANAPG